MNEDKQKYDPWFPLVRIAETLEEILRLVKADQERSRKYMEESKDPFIKTMEEGEKDDNN